MKEKDTIDERKGEKNQESEKGLLRERERDRKPDIVLANEKDKNR